MKHLPTLSLFASLFLLSVTSYAQETKVKVKEDKAKIRGTEKVTNASQDATFPYTAKYSSKFEIGDARYAAMVLNLYKSWEENKPDRVPDQLSDTITVVFTDGTIVKGKDKVLAALAQERAALAGSRFLINVFMSLHSIDRNENGVLVTGTQENTAKDGTIRAVDFMTVFGIDKDGKISYIRPYTSKHPAW